MRPFRFAVFDTETTGLLKHRDVHHGEQPKIIEFAGVITDGEEILETVRFRCNPGEALEPIITKITGITDEDLMHEPAFDTNSGTLAHFFHRAQCAIAHNMSFDQGMLTNEFARMHIELEDINFPVLRVCTVEQTMPLFGRRMKLGELYERAVGPIADAHTAMGDVKMLHEVCKAYDIYQSILRAYA